MVHIIYDTPYSIMCMCIYHIHGSIYMYRFLKVLPCKLCCYRQLMRPCGFIQYVTSPISIFPIKFIIILFPSVQINEKPEQNKWFKNICPFFYTIQTIANRKVKKIWGREEEPENHTYLSNRYRMDVFKMCTSRQEDDSKWFFRCFCYSVQLSSDEGQWCPSGRAEASQHFWKNPAIGSCSSFYGGPAELS